MAGNRRAPPSGMTPDPNRPQKPCRKAPRDTPVSVFALPPANGTSIWDLLHHGRPHFRSLTENIEVDLAVVGGGLVGLTTALAATNAGLRVAVVEKATLASGASGRTSGFVAPSLRPLPGGISLETVLGSDGARRFRGFAVDSGRMVFDLIDRHDLDVPTARAGWIEAAHTPDAFNRLRRGAGHGDQVLCADELQGITGLENLHGGVVRANSGAIDPKAYVSEIARASAEAGAKIFENTPMEALHFGADGHAELQSSAARIRAAHVVIATNGASRLLPRLAVAVMPVRVHQVVTGTLPEALQTAILGGGHVITDTRRNAVALRWTPDGRLLTGGLVLPSFRPASTEAARFYARRLAAIAGPAAERAGLTSDILEAQHIWHGRIAMTGTGLPLLYTPSSAVTALVACNGRGIALGTALGMALGEAIADGLKRGAGRMDFSALPLPATKPRPRPLRYVSGFGARWRAALAEIFDRHETRQLAKPPSNKATTSRNDKHERNE